MKTSVLFSGGRTSGFMLRLLLDAGLPEDTSVIFCNTGKERIETLNFVHEVETRWQVPVVWLEYHRVPAAEIPVGIFPTPRRNVNLARAAERGETTHWFKQVDFASASRNGEPFDELLNWMKPLPNVVSRGCSMQLKIRTSMRWLFSQGVKEYSPVIGIRKDEEPRATQILANCDSFEHPQFPLIARGVIESDVLDFWKKSEFDLQLQSYEGNCDLCFLKAKWKRIRLIKENPGMVNWWKRWESKKAENSEARNGKFFRLGEPYAKLEALAAAESAGPACEIPADEDIPCSCAERAFGPDEFET